MYRKSTYSKDKNIQLGLDYTTSVDKEEVEKWLAKLELLGVSTEGIELKGDMLGRSMLCKFPDSITYLKLPPVHKIGDKCFRNFDSLIEVEIGRSVKMLGECSFANCTSLREVKGFENINYIGNGCFMGCYSLENIHFGSCLKHIPRAAFSSCHNLNRLELVEGLESIEEYAFLGIKHLEYLVIPKSVKSIDFRVFDNVSIDKLKVPEKIMKRSGLSSISLWGINIYNLGSVVTY